MLWCTHRFHNRNVISKRPCPHVCKRLSRTADRIILFTSFFPDSHEAQEGGPQRGDPFLYLPDNERDFKIFRGIHKKKSANSPWTYPGAICGPALYCCGNSRYYLHKQDT